MNPEELIPRSEADRLVREAVEAERERIRQCFRNRSEFPGDWVRMAFNPPTEESGT